MYCYSIATVVPLQSNVAVLSGKQCWQQCCAAPHGHCCQQCRYKRIENNEKLGLGQCKSVTTSLQ